VTNLSQWQIPISFFGRFLLIAALFSVLWELVATAYLSILLPIANILLDIGDTHTHLEIHSDGVLLVFEDLTGGIHRLRFSGYELIFLYPVATVALFAATPHLETGAKLRWCTGALVAFSALQIINLYAGTYSALIQYWIQQPALRRENLAHNGWPTDISTSYWHELFFAWWNTWGGQGLALVLWIWAAKPYLAEHLHSANSNG
jgi:hypothetical protein